MEWKISTDDKRILTPFTQRRSRRKLNTTRIFGWYLFEGSKRSVMESYVEPINEKEK
jgi:hypothetical protein